MKAPPVRVTVVASLLLVLMGCAAPQPAVTDDPVVTAPSEAPEPDAKPTAAAAPGTCFTDLYDFGDATQTGGGLTWFPPLSGAEIGVEPSCWVDQLETEVNLFAAGWYGLTDDQYDLVNGPIETALQADGFELTDDTNGITAYQKPTGEMEALAVQITRTDGYYELVATYGRG